jgi:hypothetical protein
VGLESERSAIGAVIDRVPKHLGWSVMQEGGLPGARRRAAFSGGPTAVAASFLCLDVFADRGRLGHGQTVLFEAVEVKRIAFLSSRSAFRTVASIATQPAGPALCPLSHRLGEGEGEGHTESSMRARLCLWVPSPARREKRYG